MEDDAMLGQPVRHFAALGGVARLIDDVTPQAVAAASSMRMGSG
jgi:hypothetical protein